MTANVRFSGDIQPNVLAYGHLLAAYSETRNVAEAAAAFQEMQLAGIEPNLVVYTSLIKTCINARDFQTGWQIFNLIQFKSEATAPDVKTYTLMMHACAMNDEVERAVDLFKDMTVRKGLTPTAKAYHAVIHACAVRPEYFLEAWKFVTEMQRAGHPLGIQTLNVLVQACARAGDLTRARLLIRHMMASGKPETMPDKFTYQNLMRAYQLYNCPSSKSATRHQFHSANTIKEYEELFITDNLLVRKESDRSADTIPFLKKAVLQTDDEVMDEAGMIISWLRLRNAKIVDTHLMNTYLDVCISKKKLTDLKTCNKFDFENPKNPFDPNPQVEEDVEEEDALLDIDPPTVVRNIHTFTPALYAAVLATDLDFCRLVYADRLAFCKTPDYMREYQQTREKNDFMAEKYLIDVLAKKELLGEAMERVTILSQEAGIKWRFNDLKTLYTKAIQLDDMDTVRRVNELTGHDITVEKPQF